VLELIEPYLDFRKTDPVLNALVFDFSPKGNVIDECFKKKVLRRTSDVLEREREREREREAQRRKRTENYYYYYYDYYHHHHLYYDMK
jgi:hypothetical protein